MTDEIGELGGTDLGSMLIVLDELDSRGRAASAEEEKSYVREV